MKTTGTYKVISTTDNVKVMKRAGLYRMIFVGEVDPYANKEFRRRWCKVDYIKFPKYGIRESYGIDPKLVFSDKEFLKEYPDGWHIFSKDLCEVMTEEEANRRNEKEGWK